MKVTIVGGVAGVASWAARLRRLDEKAEILMVERGLLGLEVRHPQELSVDHMPGAVNIPLDELRAAWTNSLANRRSSQRHESRCSPQTGRARGDSLCADAHLTLQIMERVSVIAHMIERILATQWCESAGKASKRSLSPRPERGFHTACADLGPERQFVVHPGQETSPSPPLPLPSPWTN